MAKKFRAPKCPMCGTKQEASSQTAWEKGNYACGCNSWDYQSTRKSRVIPDGDECFPLQDGETLRFVVYGPPAILKNQKEIVLRAGRPMLVPSHRYVVWASRALKELAEAWKEMDRATVCGPIQTKMLFYMDSRRDPDLSNLYQGPEDCLQTTNIILDDKQIHSHDGSRKLYDKENPRIEIIITKFNEE